MKYLIPILFILFLLPVGCRKDADPKPADTTATNTTKSDPTDSLIGVYIGKSMLAGESKGGLNPTVPRFDTTYTIDTIYIDKISADTFKLVNKDWQAWSTGSDLENQGIYKFHAANKYTSNGYHNATSMTFVASADSLYMSSWYWGGGGSSYSTSNRFFTGKKQ